MKQPWVQNREEEHGFDGNKKVKGRKRHIVVDVLGLVVGCDVSAANTADVKAALGVLIWVVEMFKRIVKVLADQGYQGALGALTEAFFAGQQRQVQVELSRRST